MQRSGFRTFEKCQIPILVIFLVLYYSVTVFFFLVCLVRTCRIRFHSSSTQILWRSGISPKRQVSHSRDFTDCALWLPVRIHTP